MKLIKWKNYSLSVSDEAWSIKAFRDIVKRDRTIEKANAEKDLMYIYFVYDPRSDLQYILDLNDRSSRAKELLGIDDKFKIDKVMQTAIDAYISLTKTTSSELLDDIRVSVDKIRKYLREADLSDDSFDKYVRAVERLIPLAEKLTAAERIVIKEIEDLSEARGNKAQTVLDNNFDNFIS